MARISEDISSLGLMVSPGIDLIFSALLSMIVPLCFIGFLQWKLLLAPGIFVVLFFAAAIILLARVGPIVEGRMTQNGVVSAIITETLDGIELVKTAALEARQRKNIILHAKKFRNLFINCSRLFISNLPFGL